MAATVLEFKNVSKTYYGISEMQALSDITLEIAPGAFASLVGPSGSGKTTLLNLAAGLDRATSGEIFIDGQQISRLSPAELSRFRRDRLGFIFQSYNLLPLLTVQENVEFVSILRNENPKEARSRASEALERVGLASKSAQFPNQLSGGQQQRVAVARAIAARPALILADEPTANLDTKTALQLIDLFEALNKELKMTFLFSTHDHRLLHRTLHQIELQDGRLK
ncbi:MAG TPA: ABC transporter ATP-binding protein [Bdellovibrionales bacterium]|nr:ABC transporter ATP-binding protein [Bdellovibrionales bacterium]